MAEDRPPGYRAGASASPAVGGDPSMEDILASIRRILNEDEPPAGPSPANQTEPAAGASMAIEAEPLTLTEDMLVEEPVARPPRTEPTMPSSAAAAAPAPLATPVPPASPDLRNPDLPRPDLPRPDRRENESDALLAPAAAAAATASVGHLLRAVAAERGSAVNRGGPSIEDVVREELRPLLKEWLDQHLPALVERLVRAEIERVVGRALS